MKTYQNLWKSYDLQRSAGPGPARDFDVCQDLAGRVLDLERFGQDPDERV